MRFNTRKRSRVAFKVLCSFWALAVAVSNARPVEADEAAVRVMTYNMYVGSYFQPLLNVTLPGLPNAIKDIYKEIVASDPAVRAEAVAHQIDVEKPDVVGLQEAYIIRKSEQPGPGMPATIPVSDPTGSLLTKLENLGDPYEVVAVIPGNDIMVPSAALDSGATGFNVRFTYRTVMIARSGMGNDLKLSNLQVQHFLDKKILFIPLPPETPKFLVIETRGWASVDVKVRGRSFRFMTTHLLGLVIDPQHALDIQKGQATELVEAAKLTPAALPVVIVADFNVDPDNNADPSHQTYEILTTNAGFKDAWKEKFPSTKGPTCCQDPKLDNPVSVLPDRGRRFDMVLYRGNVTVEDIKVVGDKPDDRTPPGPSGSRLWPSDHAGVVARLRLSGGE